MKYDIHVSPIENGDPFGVEISPPLSDAAFSGLRTLLLRNIVGVFEPHASLVELTRNDADGTAFVIEGAQDASYYAECIGGLIDPAKLHEIELHFPAAT